MLLYTPIVDVNQLFSANLSRLRKAKAMSLRDLAAKTGISYRMIFHYENSPTAVPIKKLKVLADALDVRIADFFAEGDDSPLDSLDLRWIKKIRELQNLPEADRREINQHINSLVEKARLKSGTSA